jgi:uncharacterized protein
MKALTVNIRHLVKEDIQLSGSIEAKELGLSDLDPMIRVPGQVTFDLLVQRLEQSLLVQGRLTVQLACECVRCLKSFPHDLDLTGFAADIPLEGEGSAVEGDLVDLTPWVREDILLAFPQHPLCEPGCAGLQKPAAPGNEAQPGQESQTTSPVWAVLNRLEL